MAKKTKAAGNVDKALVLVTCPDATMAGEMARALVEARLAACVNVLASPVGSIYRWKGKVKHAPEHLLLMKTALRLLPLVESVVKRMHTYKVPEIIALPITAGSFKYLKWIEECLLSRRPAKQGKKKK